jgi:hypothetical protein
MKEEGILVTLNSSSNRGFKSVWSVTLIEVVSKTDKSIPLKHSCF